MKVPDNMLVNGIPDLIEDPVRLENLHPYRSKVEKVHTLKLGGVVLGVFAAFALLRAGILQYADSTRIFITDILDAQLMAAAFLCLAGMIAIQQAVRGLRAQRENVKRQMREQTLQHIREKLAEFRAAESKVIQWMQDTLKEQDQVFYARHAEEGPLANAPRPIDEKVLTLLDRELLIRSDVRSMLESLEQIGSGVARGVYGLVVVDNTVGATIIDTWQRWHPFAMKRRESLPIHCFSLDQLQWLASVLLHWRLLRRDLSPEARAQLTTLAGQDHFRFDDLYNPSYIVRSESVLHHLMCIASDQVAFKSACEAAAKKGTKDPESVLKDVMTPSRHPASQIIETKPSGSAVAQD